MIAGQTPRIDVPWCGHDAFRWHPGCAACRVRGYPGPEERRAAGERVLEELGRGLAAMPSGQRASL